MFKKTIITISKTYLPTGLSGLSVYQASIYVTQCWKMTKIITISQHDGPRFEVFSSC